MDLRPGGGVVAALAWARGKERIWATCALVQMSRPSPAGRNCDSSIGRLSSRKSSMGSKTFSSAASGTRTKYPTAWRGSTAVVGNPPYVRMELIKPLKPFLRVKYRCHAERADLFIYFYERALALLKRGGYSAFIASSTWTKTKAGEGLRDFSRARRKPRVVSRFRRPAGLPRGHDLSLRHGGPGSSFPPTITRFTRPLSIPWITWTSTRSSPKAIAACPKFHLETERLEFRRPIRAAASREDPERGCVVERVLRLAALRNQVGVDRCVRNRCLYLRTFAGPRPAEQGNPEAVPGGQGPQALALRVAQDYG